MKGLIFTYVMTYGGAIAALFDPYIGLLVYIAFAILKPDAMWAWAVPQGSYSRIVALAMLAGWALHGFGRWQMGRAKPVIVLLVIYWAWAVVCALLAPVPEVAWGFVAALTKVVLPVLVGITVIDTVGKARLLAWVIVLSEGYLAFELNLSYLQGHNRVYEDGFAGSDNNVVAISMVTCMGLAFFLGLGAGVRWWRRLVAFGSAALMAHVVMIAQSRGGMLAMGVTGAMAFYLIPKTAASLVAFAAAAVLAVRLAGPRVRDRFLTIFSDKATRDASAQSRLYLWRDALDAAGKHPVFGIGPDHWPLVAQQNYGWVGAVNEAHSLWVQIAAELGFPGLILLVAFYGTCAARLWKLARGKVATSDPWLSDAARMVIASLTGFAVSAQFVSVKGLETPFYIALLGACVLKLSSLPAPAPAAAAEDEAATPVRRPLLPRGRFPAPAAPEPVG